MRRSLRIFGLWRSVLSMMIEKVSRYVTSGFSSRPDLYIQMMWHYKQQW